MFENRASHKVPWFSHHVLSFSPFSPPFSSGPAVHPSLIASRLSLAKEVPIAVGIAASQVSLNPELWGHWKAYKWDGLHHISDDQFAIPKHIEIKASMGLCKPHIWNCILGFYMFICSNYIHSYIITSDIYITLGLPHYHMGLSENRVYSQL